MMPISMANISGNPNLSLEGSQLEVEAGEGQLAADRGATRDWSAEALS